MAKRPDYITCKKCTHTINVHKNEGACGAYLCGCEKFEN